MAQLKTYVWQSYHVYDKRVENILTEPRQQARYSAYAVAYSKADAARFAKEARCSYPAQSDLRVGNDGNEFNALREASLFETEGTVLVTANRGGKKPVVLCAPDNGYGDEGTGAQVIGILRPADGRIGMVFEATTAKYAGRGSVAVGAEVAYVKKDVGYPEGIVWVGTDGQALVDQEMQKQIDLGELNIIRSGFGDWFMAGR
jgi:hypothetical protein